MAVAVVVGAAGAGGLCGVAVATVAAGVGAGLVADAAEVFCGGVGVGAGVELLRADMFMAAVSCVGIIGGCGANMRGFRGMMAVEVAVYSRQIGGARWRVPWGSARRGSGWGELLDRVERGEEIVIERDGRAVSKLVPVAASAQREANGVGVKRAAGRRRFGDNFLGITYIAPDFYDDLPLEMFEVLRENGDSYK